ADDQVAPGEDVVLGHVERQVGVDALRNAVLMALRLGRGGHRQDGGDSQHRGQEGTTHLRFNSLSVPPAGLADGLAIAGLGAWRRYGRITVRFAPCRALGWRGRWVPRSRRARGGTRQ